MSDEGMNFSGFLTLEDHYMPFMTRLNWSHKPTQNVIAPNMETFKPENSLHSRIYEVKKSCSKSYLTILQ